jgi:pyridoxal phosphate enzyme (YggS family)
MTEANQLIAERLAIVRERMARAAARAGRDPASVRLVAVTKTQPPAAVAAAVDAGVTDIGENRVQEAIAKFAELGWAGAGAATVRRHLIGHLQTNKAKLAVQHFDMIHSVDSARLASELNRHAAAAGIIRDILVEVNVSGEQTKFGLAPEAVPDVLAQIASSCPALRVQGFMTMAPFEAQPEATRPVFARLRELASQWRRDAAAGGLQVGSELSMGMTNDFEVAIEEGATLVRIGTAIFGAR